MLSRFSSEVIWIEFPQVYQLLIFQYNSALVGAAIIRLKGGNPTLADGIKIASSHISSIVGYALISSTVGIILKWVQERLGFWGKILSFISNIAWNLVTYLVIPILVVEGIGPIEAVKRSSQLLKKTWGEQLIGNIGIGLLSGLLTFALIILFVPLVVYTAIESMYIAAIGLGAIFGISILLLIIVSSTLNTIYMAALYLYTANGIVSDNFDGDVLRNSFKQK